LDREGNQTMKKNKTRGLILCAGILLSFFGCTVFGNSFLIYQQPTSVKKKYIAPDEGDYFLAVTVSGGGSRSAVWCAAVFRELFEQIKLPDGRSILDEIDYISCVSGGSLASAYYCMNKPPVDTTHTEKYTEFFEKYLADMRTNIEQNIFLRPWLWYRVLYRSEELGLLLKEEFDEKFFYSRSFDDLYKRQDLGWCPTLIINGTGMDTGSKFLFTTLSRSDFDFMPIFASEIVSGTGIGKSNIHFEDEVLGLTFCDDIGLSIGDMDVSRAVVASSAVPLVFGPIVLKDQTDPDAQNDTYLHISDGGVTDSLGLETVLQLIIDRFGEKDGKKYRGGMVIILDVAPRVNPEDSENLVRGFSAAETISQTMRINQARGKTLTYVTTIFLQNDPRFKDIAFVYISPYMIDNPEMIEKVKKTATRFKIKPELADNLECAAEIAVGRVKDRIIANFEGRKFPETSSVR